MSFKSLNISVLAFIKRSERAVVYFENSRPWQRYALSSLFSVAVSLGVAVFVNQSVFPVSTTTSNDSSSAEEIVIVKQAKPSFHLVNMGGGAFEFSNNLDGTAYFLNTTARSISYSRREYFSSFARFYYEPLVQVNYWTGDIRPQANDTVDDELLSSLTSDYSIYGGTLGIKTGFTWYGEQWSVDVGIIQLSKSMILSESYTNNSSRSRESVRSQISDVLRWSGINVSILYKI